MTQTIAGEFFKQGHYPQHLESLKNLYRSRRDAMVKALDAYFPEGTKHTYPDGGYYVWVELPKELDTGKLAPGSGREASTSVTETVPSSSVKEIRKVRGAIA